MKLRSLIEEKTSYKIYCDMDGVLTDFSGDFIKLAMKIGETDIERDDVPTMRSDMKKNTEVKHLESSRGCSQSSSQIWNPKGNCGIIFQNLILKY